MWTRKISVSYDCKWAAIFACKTIIVVFDNVTLQYLYHPTGKCAEDRDCYVLLSSQKVKTLLTTPVNHYCRYITGSIRYIALCTIKCCEYSANIHLLWIFCQHTSTVNILSRYIYRRTYCNVWPPATAISAICDGFIWVKLFKSFPLQ